MKSFIAILRKYKLAMFMNFVGLALAFIAFMSLMLQVENQLGFDRHYPTAGNIFRVDKVGVAKDDIFRNILPRGYADDIIGSSAHIKAGSISSPYVGELVLTTLQNDNNHKFRYGCNVCYPQIFDVFGVKIVEGSFASLNDLQQIAIPASLARKLYGDESAIGKIIFHHEQHKLGAFRSSELVVGAVYEDVPKNSQFDNDIYMHIGSIQEGNYGGANCVCWLLLDSPCSKTLVEESFNRNFNYQDTTWLTDIELTPIEDIYFGEAEGAAYKSGSYLGMWIMLCISVVIILVGGINYTTFFTALSPMRVRNINTQKVLGSTLGQLRLSLISESVIFSLCAFVFALLLIVPITQWLVQQGLIFTSFAFFVNWKVVALMCAVSVLIGIIAGLYPSFYVTSLPAAFALKGDFGFSAGGNGFRTGMLVFQYLISFILLMVAIIINRQNKFMMEYESGFAKDDIAVVEISQTHVLDKSEWLTQQLCSLVEVKDVAFSMELIGGNDEYSVSSIELDGNTVQFYTLYCSANFLDVMGIEVVEGRNFTDSDKAGCLIINQKMKELGADLEDKNSRGGIIGVTGPVRINSLRREEVPFCYVILPKEYGLMRNTYIRLQDNCDKKQALDKINSVLTQMDPDHLFEVKLYEQITKELYADQMVQEQIISLFSFLACVLSLIGIFGQALLDVQYRKRDIAIKRVYGADTIRILKEGAVKYVIIVLVSFIISLGVVWVIVEKYLENFVERMPLTIWPFVYSFGLIMSCTIVIVTIQYYRAANMNPSGILKAQ